MNYFVSKQGTFAFAQIRAVATFEQIRIKSFSAHFMLGTGLRFYKNLHTSGSPISLTDALLESLWVPSPPGSLEAGFLGAGCLNRLYFERGWNR